MLKFKKTKYISLDYSEPVGDEITTNSRKALPIASDTELIHQKKDTAHYMDDMIYEEEETERGPSVPDGAWIKCHACTDTIYNEDLIANLRCCPKCGAHFRMDAQTRIHTLFDNESFVEWDKNVTTKNVLDFPEYEKKIKNMQMTAGIAEGVITGEGTIDGFRTAVAVMDANFMMGSMGQAVGEKITRAIEKATEKHLPILIFTTSGGARMQEGMVSLMQMAKTSAALKRHSDTGLLYIAILTDPTTGGVTASFAMLGDITLAEPGALIGFAGPRVIEQTIGQKLPEGFQHAEFLIEKGFVDRIVQRKHMKEELVTLLRIHGVKNDFTKIMEGEEAIC